MRRRQEGFTVVELLVAMTLTLVVGGALLTLFDGFGRSAAAADRLAAAQDSARRGMGVVVRSLRNAGAAPSGATPATTVLRAQPLDIVFRTTDWPGESRQGTGLHVVRYCMDTSRNALWFEGLRAGATGSTDPGTACPSTAPGWQRRLIVDGLMNTASSPLFTYAPSVTNVKSVGIDLAIAAGSAGRLRQTHLRSAATLRGTLVPRIDVHDIQVQCQSDGSGALLSLGVGFDDDGNPLRLTSSTGVSVGPSQILVGAGTSSVGVVVTNVLGLSKALIKQVSC